MERRNLLLVLAVERNKENKENKERNKEKKEKEKEGEEGKKKKPCSSSDLRCFDVGTHRTKK